jgi:tetratricopeptide (TPR) repeat protein
MTRQPLTHELHTLVDARCDQFERAWSSAEPLQIESLLDGVPPAALPRLFRELLLLEIDLRVARNDQPLPADYLTRFPAQRQVVEEVFAVRAPCQTDVRRAIATAEHSTHDHTPVTPGSGRLEVRCPNCHAPTEVAVDTALTDLTCGSCGSHFSIVDKSKATRMAPPLSQMGRFQLIERLGVGGFGSVWKARDQELDRSVAIKIPRASGMSPDDQEKFFREARAAAQLRHPNIVSVHEVGRDGDSVYIVSDFVRGVTLGDWLTAQQLTGREAAELCAKVADALHHAHERGVVHRDLKPANIMIDGAGEPHVMDFGLARREVGEVTMTVDGQVLGTPAYMSPEQAQGEAHTADRRSDVYSLGVILFQLLTGELPFRGNARMIMHQVIHDDPPSPRKLNANIKRDLETIALKCLEKSPERRYESMVELADELRRFLRGQPIHARPATRLERGWRWGRRNPVTASMACLVVIATLLGFAGVTWQWLRAEENLAEAKRQRLRAEENLAEAKRQESQAIIQKQAAISAKDKAKTEAATTQETVSFLVKLFTSSDVTGFAGAGFLQSGEEAAQLTALQMLERGRTQLNALSDRRVQSALRDIIGSVYANLGKTDVADQELEQALKLREELFGAESLEVAETKRNLARIRFAAGEYERSEQLYREALAVQQKLGADDRTIATTKFHLAWALAIKDPNAKEEVFRLFQEAHTVRSRPENFDKRELAESNLAMALAMPENRRIEAVLHAGQAFALLGSSDAVARVIVKYVTATTARSRGDRQTAEKIYRELEPEVRKFLPPNHYLLAAFLGDMAQLLHELEKTDEADQRDEEAIAIAEKTFGKHREMVHALRRLAIHDQSRGNLDRAAERYRKAVDIAIELDSLQKSHVRQALDGLLDVLSKTKDASQQLEVCRELYGKVLKKWGVGHPDEQFAFQRFTDHLRAHGADGSGAVIEKDRAEATTK